MQTIVRRQAHSGNVESGGHPLPTEGSTVSQPSQGIPSVARNRSSNLNNRGAEIYRSLAERGVPVNRDELMNKLAAEMYRDYDEERGRIGSADDLWISSFERIVEGVLGEEFEGKLVSTIGQGEYVEFLCSVDYKAIVKLWSWLKGVCWSEEFEQKRSLLPRAHEKIDQFFKRVRVEFLWRLIDRFCVDASEHVSNEELKTMALSMVLELTTHRDLLKGHKTSELKSRLFEVVARLSNLNDRDSQKVLSFLSGEELHVMVGILEPLLLNNNGALKTLLALEKEKMAKDLQRKQNDKHRFYHHLFMSIAFATCFIQFLYLYLSEFENEADRQARLNSKCKWIAGILIFWVGALPLFRRD